MRAQRAVGLPGKADEEQARCPGRGLVRFGVIGTGLDDLARAGRRATVQVEPATETGS